MMTPVMTHETPTRNKSNKYLQLRAQLGDCAKTALRHNVRSARVAGRTARPHGERAACGLRREDGRALLEHTDLQTRVFPRAALGVVRAHIAAVLHCRRVGVYICVEHRILQHHTHLCLAWRMAVALALAT